MKKYALILSYTGTSFCGWQKQKLDAEEKGLPSIQSTIENALHKMTQESEVRVVGSGRTDAGVHAVYQVAHFTLKSKRWSTEVLQKGLNGILPQTIRVQQVLEVSIDFHAQRSALKKQYSFYFQQGPSALAHLEPYTWWIQKPLDIQSMNQAIQDLKGEHDFRPFQASGANTKSTHRTLLEADVLAEPIGFPQLTLNTSFFLVRVRLVGTGFLKQMVRGIAGTLLQVGESRRDKSCFREILGAQKRILVGPTAPAKALWLEKVWYEFVDL